MREQFLVRQINRKVEQQLATGWSLAA